MKKILLLFLFIPVLSIAQTRPPVEIQYSADYKKNIQVRDTSKLDKVLFEDGTIQTTAYNVDSVAAQIHDSIAALTIGEPLYEGDSAQLKENIRELLNRTDTTQELVARTIYVSIPTDPQTPGNDVTGNGSISLPYATITRALYDYHGFVKTVKAQITIQLDSSNFNFTDQDVTLINNINANGLFNITSRVDTLYSKTSITLSAGSSNYIRVASGITFSNYELRGLFLLKNGVYYPIERNYGQNIYIGAITSITGTGWYIVRFKSTINLTNRNSIVLRNSGQNTTTTFSFYFSNVNITFPASSPTNHFLINNVFFRYCKITSSMSVNMSSYNCALGCYWNTTTTGVLNILNGAALSLQGNVFRGIGTGVLFYVRGFQDIYGNIISNYTTVFNFNFNGFLSETKNNYYIKNTTLLAQQTNAITQSPAIHFNQNIIIDSLTNLIDITVVGANHNIIIPSITGTYTNIFTSGSVSKAFRDLNYGAFINIPGTYPEYQQKQSVTLANNSTDSISIADLTYNRSVELKVNLVRGTDYQTKTLKLLNTGTTYNFVQLGDSIQTGDLGVRFDGVYRSGGSNTLKLKWRTTSTGTNATMVYDAYRQNF